jgi:23S rRNA pseudouridine2605 synthase
MTDAAAKGERIAKRIAAAGLCSRRDAERWIADGRVVVDGKVLTSPALNVFEGTAITVDGAPLPAAGRARLWRYHKPAGIVTTHRDPQGRPTVFERLPTHLPRVVSVGRLDLDSEGLLLLTTSGELARKFESPATKWSRSYRVRVFGRPTPEVLGDLAKGITIEGVRYDAIEAALDRQQGGNAWLTVALREGKNREVRRVLAHFGWPVNRLIRTDFGPFRLGPLARGNIEEVPDKVVRKVARA